MHSFAHDHSLNGSGAGSQSERQWASLGRDSLRRGESAVPSRPRLSMSLGRWWNMADGRLAGRMGGSCCRPCRDIESRPSSGGVSFRPKCKADRWVVMAGTFAMPPGSPVWRPFSLPFLPMISPFWHSCLARMAGSTIQTQGIAGNRHATSWRNGENPATRRPCPTTFAMSQECRETLRHGRHAHGRRWDVARHFCDMDLSVRRFWTWPRHGGPDRPCPLPRQGGCGHAHGTITCGRSQSRGLRPCGPCLASGAPQVPLGPS